MIAPTDPRHGTTNGYAAGCKCDGCREARNYYERLRRKRRALYGDSARLAVDATGTKRRVQALMRLGWTSQHIADECGWTSGNAALQAARCKWVQRPTADAIAKAYRRLSVRQGPSEETRKRAIAKGWPSPMHWDEGAIDDPNAHPYDYTPPKPTKRNSGKKRRGDVDESVVLAVLSGERRETTPGEKQEIGRRWRAMGKPMAELARVTGWTKVERYGRAA